MRAATESCGPTAGCLAGGEGRTQGAGPGPQGAPPHLDVTEQAASALELEAAAVEQPGQVVGRSAPDDDQPGARIGAGVGHAHRQRLVRVGEDARRHC